MCSRQYSTYRDAENFAIRSIHVDNPAVVIGHTDRVTLVSETSPPHRAKVLVVRHIITSRHFLVLFFICDGVDSPNSLQTYAANRETRTSASNRS